MWWGCKNPFSQSAASQRTDTVKVDLSVLGQPQKENQSDSAAKNESKVAAHGQPEGGVLDKIQAAAKGWIGQLTEISLEYPYEDLLKATDGFSAEMRLGAGAAGAVYRGILQGGTEVAIKVLFNRGGLEGFEDEVRVLSRFRHPNLVTLFGWGHHGDEKYLVYELLEGGDVDDSLKKCRERDVPFMWPARLRVALTAASGLSHMVNSQPMAFHRDIKPANIMLDADGSAKMADFGLAGVVHAEGKRHLVTTNISGTPGYTCPAYMQTGRVSEHSEVYSFGTVLLELMMNQPPCLVGPQGDVIYPILQVVQPAAPGAHARLLGALDPRARWPRGLAEELGDLALACTDMVPDRRPPFASIVRSLRRLSEASGVGSG